MGNVLPAIPAETLPENLSVRRLDDRGNGRVRNAPLRRDRKVPHQRGFHLSELLDAIVLQGMLRYERRGCKQAAACLGILLQQLAVFDLGDHNWLNKVARKPMVQDSTQRSILRRQ